MLDTGIQKIFPNIFQRKRVRRGLPAQNTIISLPTNKEFYSLLFNKNIFYLEEKSQRTHISSIFLRENFGYKDYGLFCKNFCNCSSCAVPLARCKNYEQLQDLFENSRATTIWFRHPRELIESIRYNEFVNTAFTDKIVFFLNNLCLEEK